MIVKFDNFKLITENPDNVWDEKNIKKYTNNSDKAIPFLFEVNDGHTKVKKIRIGKPGVYHGDIKKNNRNKSCYPGRLWLDGKIMAFWVYPNEQLFVSIIKSLEKKLNIKIFNNGWRIEVQEQNGILKRREFDPNDDFYINDGGYQNAKLIPLEDFAGSADIPEEQYIQHMMNWKEKEQAKKAGKLSSAGFGSTKTGWDQPHNLKYRQAIYQENKNTI